MRQPCLVRSDGDLAVGGSKLPEKSNVNLQRSVFLRDFSHFLSHRGAGSQDDDDDVPGDQRSAIARRHRESALLQLRPQSDSVIPNRRVKVDLHPGRWRRQRASLASEFPNATASISNPICPASRRPAVGIPFELLTHCHRRFVVSLIMFDLVVQSGKLEGKRLLLPLDKDVVIGRDASCQIVLGSSRISRRHCRLRRTERGVQVEDLGSQNGTYVNDVPITAETLMVAGDTMRVGAMVFEIQPHQKRESGSGTRHKTPMPSKPPNFTPIPNEKSPALSDYEIITWLSDHEIAASSSGGDKLASMIEALTPPPGPMHASVLAAAKAAVPPPSSKTSPVGQASVKEQAAEIIRRHWAQTRQKPIDPPAGS
jgi:hypothetical protein